MQAKPVLIETVAGAAQTDDNNRLWFRDFSVPSRSRRPRYPGLHGRINPFLSRFFRLVLVHRTRTFQDVALDETDPTTEYHHHLYCRSWAVGRDHMDYLLRRGLRPEHRVLDFGCGALRTGIWVIRHLDPGHYFGLDAHRRSLEAAVRYEIPLHGLEDQQPRLLHSTKADVEHFGGTFDYILLMAVLIHLAPEEQIRILGRLSKVLAPGGRIVIWRCPDELSDASIRSATGLSLTHRETTRSRFGDFTLDWTELQHANQP